MRQYQGLSLCTGILGFELGMQLAGLNRHIDIRQCVEINPYCQQLIKLRLPGVPIWGDLTTYVPPDGFEPDRTIIWSGFPCQPVSQAGKQRGDEDKRYLWPHILRLIRQIRPVVWMGENVDGLRTIDSGRLFGSILEGLAESGYCVEWSCVSAAEVGAVHKRERVWLIAYRPEAIAHSQSFQEDGERGQSDSFGISGAAWLATRERDRGDRAGDLPTPTNTNSFGRFGSPSTERKYQNFLHQERDSSKNQQSGSERLGRIDEICSTPANTESWQFPIQSNQWGNSFTQETRANFAPVGSGTKSANTTGDRCTQQLQKTNKRREEPWVGNGLFPNQNAQPVFCGSNDGIPADLGGYLLRHAELEQWLTAATIPTFTRLTSEETRSLSPEDQREYKQLLGEYHRTKKQYEQWLEALGNAICPHQSAIAWHRVGQILGLQ